MNIEFVNQILTNLEKQFVDYINSDNKYPFKNESFKFMIVSIDANKETVCSFFDGYLKDYLVLQCQNYYLVIYHNKERIEIRNIVDLINEDFGQKIKIFEGFLVNDKDKLIKFIKIFDMYTLENSYSNIADLVYLINKKEILSELKNILLEKYLLDKEFINLVNALFKNNLNVSKTASDVYMHRNTINNKLNNFERDSTLAIQNFKDAVALYELLK